MPNIKSAKKRVKTNLRDEAKNRAAKSAIKTAIKSTNEKLATADAKEGKVLLSSTQSLIGRAAKRGVIHKNKMARLQSRLAKRVQRSTAK